MKNVKVYDENNEDIGYLGNRQNWWFDQNFEDSFEIFNLDTFYNDHYFEEDHVKPATVKKYVDNILFYYKEIKGKELSSVVEFGCAGGWFTKAFQDRGIDIFAFEGTHGGYNKAIGRGVDKNKIKRQDLRRPFDLNRRFDIAICTEVAEHIEPPFSSQFILNITNHSDLIWFSFEVPGTNDAHYHHCNEQPEKFWKNIFEFMNYGMYKLPNKILKEIEDRGGYIFYKNNTEINPLYAMKPEISELNATAGGGKQEKTNKLLKWYKLLTPPILQKFFSK